MYRFLPILVAGALAGCVSQAGDPKGPLRDDLQQLHGVWVSPPLQLMEDLEGRAEIVFEFQDPAKRSGRARLNFVPLDKLAPAQTVGLLGAEVRETGPGREIVLTDQNPTGGKGNLLLTLAYELKGDQLKLMSAKPFRHPTLMDPVDLSGEWQRVPRDKN